MRCFLFTLSLFVTVGQTLLLADDKLEDVLNHQYKGHIYTLRQPMTAGTQHYDSLGNSPTASALGPWTVDGRLLIKKIKVEPNKLVVEGQRSGVEFDAPKGTLVPAKLDQKVKLEISLDQPLDSPEHAHAILGHIFAFTQQDFVASMPELWKKYLTSSLESYSADGQQMTFKRPARGPQKLRPLDPVRDQKPEPLDGIYHVGNGVSAPRPTYSPDPNYSVVARANKFQGTAVFTIVVGPDGNVHNVQLARPLGLGLDETSAEMIKTWKFEPGKRNGEPVAVEVSVEVQFQLY